MVGIVVDGAIGESVGANNVDTVGIDVGEIVGIDVGG